MSMKNRPFGRLAAVVGIAVAGAAAFAGFDSASSEPVRLEVDVSERTLVLGHEGGADTFAVAVGEPEHPTPRGQFTIDRLVWDPAWVPPPNAEWADDNEKREPADPKNPMEAAKLFFEYPDYYIHGTDATNTLGQAESHGCVRMRPSDVERLAELVQEHGGKDWSEARFQRVKAREKPKVEVALPDPIPIEIHD